MTRNAWNAEYNSAKGAILVGNATEPVVVPVGTDGQVLTADSAQATGLSWIANSSLAWSRISANQAGLANNGYICVAPGGVLQVALPAISSVGDTFELVLRGATSWQITQAAGQQIFIANSSTTLGVGGSIASTAQGDAVRLVCSVVNLEWVAISGFIGNLTIV